MATLSDIANVTIALNTTSVARANFGTQMITSPLASFAERVRTYSDFDATNPDNLPPILQTALSDAFAQIPRPRQVKVGRLSILKAAIAPVDAVGLAVYSLKLGTTLISVTAAASPTTTTIATQLAAAINAAAVGVTATAVAGVVELVFIGAIIPVTTFTKIQWDVITSSATAGILAADLGEIKLEDDAWYVLHLTERTTARVLLAAEWTEAQEKIFVTASQNSDILTPGISTDVVSLLKASQYFRTAIAYHGKANTEFADVAWASRVLTIPPGGETWALKKLASVTPDKLSATDRVTIFGKNGNTFEYYQTSIALTGAGKVAGGEWIDIIRFRDYLKDLIQTNLVMLMINRDKIPYTDGGIQLLGNNLIGSLRTGQNVGGISPDEINAAGDKVPGFNTTIPLSSEVDDITKASRVVYLKFNARIAGAIHVTDVSGALAYSLD